MNFSRTTIFQVGKDWLQSQKVRVEILQEKLLEAHISLLSVNTSRQSTHH